MSDLLTSRALAAQSPAVLAVSVADGAAEIERLQWKCVELKGLLREAIDCLRESKNVATANLFDQALAALGATK